MQDPLFYLLIAVWFLAALFMLVFKTDAFLNSWRGGTPEQLEAKAARAERARRDRNRLAVGLFRKFFG